ncbi:unnamed protein product [Vitrella brassicaformis CCMP3155]|uniref:HTH CENPB-type domain-containing protein n=2 Tax=Vitrella brassicaformis TaxID=1169539 RepID=A0A0G4EQ27_VITBC|nr:unnamed protein product [Vitrella brassicaformis CCMP3155]|eukprot:CEL99529.1 unnamed protein product [Vitrella brassicaformis CCMP3155]
MRGPTREEQQRHVGQTQVGHGDESREQQQGGPIGPANASDSTQPLALAEHVKKLVASDPLNQGLLVCYGDSSGTVSIGVVGEGIVKQFPVRGDGQGQVAQAIMLARQYRDGIIPSTSVCSPSDPPSDIPQDRTVLSGLPSDPNAGPSQPTEGSFTAGHEGSGGVQQSVRTVRRDAPMPEDLQAGGETPREYSFSQPPFDSHFQFSVPSVLGADPSTSQPLGRPSNAPPCQPDAEPRSQPSLHLQMIDSAGTFSPATMPPSPAFGQTGQAEHPWDASALPPNMPLMRSAHGSSHHRTASVPPSLSTRRPATAQFSHEVSDRASYRALKVAIGMRLGLVDEFIRRKESGENISKPQFARENGLDPKLFNKWYYSIKTQRAKSIEVTDLSNKRITPLKYPQIEDPMREWMASQGDPAAVPPRAIKRKAMKIAFRLGIDDRFSASDNWVTAFKKRYMKAFKERCQQNSPWPCEGPAAAAAPPAADNTDGMASMDWEEPEYFNGAMHPPETFDELLNAIREVIDGRARGQDLIAQLQMQSPQEIGLLVWRLDALNADNLRSDAVRLLAARISEQLRLHVAQTDEHFLM